MLKSRERFVCLDKNGRELWSYAGAKDIDRIIPIDKSRALIVRKSYAEIYANEVPKNMEAPE